MHIFRRAAKLLNHVSKIWKLLLLLLLKILMLLIIINSPAAFFQLNGFILSQYFINALKKFMIMILISLKTERKQRIRVFLDLIKY